MNLDNFLIRLIILCLPGIVCYFVTSKFIGKIGRVARCFVGDQANHLFEDIRIFV